MAQLHMYTYIIIHNNEPTQLTCRYNTCNISLGIAIIMYVCIIIHLKIDGDRGNPCYNAIECYVCITTCVKERTIYSHVTLQQCHIPCGI